MKINYADIRPEGNNTYYVKYSNGKRDTIERIGQDYYYKRTINNTLCTIKINDPQTIVNINSSIKEFNQRLKNKNIYE